MSSKANLRSALIVAVALAACSSPPKLLGAGKTCFQATDCQAGLVCVPQSNQTRVCSSDLSSLVRVPEGGGVLDATSSAQVVDGGQEAEAAAPLAGGDAGDEG
jgi:ABC-type Fe3+-hydroxamate transport system substrate-binding protein